MEPDANQKKEFKQEEDFRKSTTPKDVEPSMTSKHEKDGGSKSADETIWDPAIIQQFRQITGS